MNYFTPTTILQNVKGVWFHLVVRFLIINQDAIFGFMPDYHWIHISLLIILHIIILQTSGKFNPLNKIFAQCLCSIEEPCLTHV